MPFCWVKIKRAEETAWIHVCNLRQPSTMFSRESLDFGYMETNVEVESMSYSPRASQLELPPHPALALDLLDVNDDLRVAAMDVVSDSTFAEVQETTAVTLKPQPPQRGAQSLFCGCDGKGMHLEPATKMGL